MSESYVQVPVDSTGKKLRTQYRTVEGNIVHEQLVGCLDSSGNRINMAKEDGNLANIPKKSTTPAIYNVTMTNANTEYSQALPSNCKKFLIHTRDGTSFRLAFTSGKVAGPTEPYFTVPSGQAYYEDFIEPTSLTLYFACESAGKIVEIISWS
ncbi:hypothetical protein KEJ51_09005 [Candidatus Bathyarchaeota archaeon]|nr:hypothetical protein [Candidatus Bathyarchaeota archaeon]MBS7629194.1 hypothetical protein [Candidatus Bathyarchaeota archaeon]